ncbi:hypothetical protein ABBQ38_002858 [Trebouxia sp. C0009 RCD-2024]
MTKQLPDRRFRVKFFEPWERANGVTITFQAGGGVYKQIRGFESWVKNNSPGSNIDVMKSVYQVAASCRHLAHAIAPPDLHLKEAQYRVTLIAYGPQANPGTIQGAQRLSQQWCEAAAALHCNGYVMRDFRPPNVLTRAGVEGDYVVVDLEYAGPTGQPWDPELPTDWDGNTLTMGVYDEISDMYQIGVMICSLDLWQTVTKPRLLSEFVQLLSAKQVTASEALCHRWIASANPEYRTAFKSRLLIINSFFGDAH